MEKNGQSSIEFFLLVGFTFFFFITFLFLLQMNTAQKNYDKIDLEVREIALIIQDEITLAHLANEGYWRNFTLPEEVMWLDYNATVISNGIYVITEDQKHSIYLNTFNVSGQPTKGQNLIRNVNGIVYLN